MPYKNRNSLSLHIKNNIRMLFGGKDALRLRGKINPVLVKNWQSTRLCMIVLFLRL